MTIKRKIWLSNVLMILIPILSTSIIIIVCLNTSLGSYWHTLVSMYSMLERLTGDFRFMTGMIVWIIL